MISPTTRVMAAVSPLGIGGAAITFSEMPWAIAALIAVGVLGVAFTRAVMPQESSDRLRWWQSRWERGAGPRRGPGGRHAGR